MTTLTVADLAGSCTPRARCSTACPPADSTPRTSFAPEAWTASHHAQTPRSSRTSATPHNSPSTKPGRTIDAQFVRAVNAAITRSGALHPGQLRTPAQGIGVATPHGRHAPDALTDAELQTSIDRATDSDDVQNNALDLFVNLAKAQPFEDGNKRTAVFVANSLLISTGAGVLLTIPVDDNDPALARTFNDLLARAYIYDDLDEVKALLRSRGITNINPTERDPHGN